MGVTVNVSIEALELMCITVVIVIALWVVTRICK
jgi:hypothetical protein